MRRRIFLPAIAMAVVSVSCNKPDKSAATAESAPPAASAAPDFEKIAESIITRTVAVREGDAVAIVGPVRDLELMEDLATWSEKNGAGAMVVLTTERMRRRSFDDVPAKYDSQPPVWGPVMVNTATVSIAIEDNETPDLLAHVPAERLAARSAAGAGLFTTAMRRNARQLSIGNGMYPTHATAARFGMSREQLASFFWSALNADFTTIQNNAKYLKDAIGAAKELQITDANGTDIRFKIARGKWLVSDGVWKSTDRGADNVKYLPAGEIFSTVDVGTAEGRIVADRYWFGGKTLEQFTINVSGGKLVSMTAKADIDGLQNSYNAAGAGKEVLSVIDFGVNPGIKASAAKTLRNWVPEGMVTLNFGNDQWANGTNSVPFSIAPSLASATVKADGKVIIENGNIKR